MDVKMLTGDTVDRKTAEEIAPLENSEICYHKNILNSILKGSVDTALSADISKIDADIEELTKAIEEIQSRPRTGSYSLSCDFEDDEGESDGYEDCDDDIGYSCGSSSYSTGYRSREIADHRVYERRITVSTPERLRITEDGNIIRR